MVFSKSVAFLEQQNERVEHSTFHFKQNWDGGLFQSTRKEPFYYGGHYKAKLVDMMRHTGRLGVADVPELDARALDLAFSGNQYSLMLIVPNDMEGLSDMESKLASINLANVWSLLKGRIKSRMIRAAIPRFGAVTQHVSQLDKDTKGLQLIALERYYSMTLDLCSTVARTV